jgi:diguanylate cyclase (GGDEF)-like protein
MIAILAMALVFGGAVILVGSLFLTRRLIEQLPQGLLRSYWFVMLVLVCVFVSGYLAYGWLSISSHTRPSDLIVPAVFFLGACFVWLTSHLSLQTAVTVMQISLLEQENISDPLTLVFNRRYLDRRLSDECERARKFGLPLSVLLLDIDHFKQVNDRFGHPAGDQVLVSFAERVKQGLREPDILARYGGEEFMVIAMQTPRGGAVEVAERLRKTIESNRFRLTPAVNGTSEIRLTCSIGVASLGDGIDAVSKLIAAADENLYRAKHQGRNQVCADPAGGSGPPAPDPVPLPSPMA